jgi:prophage regulatory protein
MKITTSIPTLLRLTDVLVLRGIGKSQHYEDIQKGLFTPPIKIGTRASAWPAHEVAAINSARIAGKTEDQIRKKVTDLIIARTAGGCI